MRQRLAALGRGASIEVSPAQVLSDTLKYTLVGALDGGGRPPLGRGARVFVNMVKMDEGHFEDVAAAVAALAARGVEPVPHVPACRFGSEAAAAATLRRLVAAGGSQALLLGGNDQGERGEQGVPFPGADELLRSGAPAAAAVRGVMLAGHPEGHPGLGNDAARTAALLEGKVATALRAGHTVSVVSQLCFDGGLLLSWLAKTRTALAQLAGEVAAELGGETPAIKCLTPPNYVAPAAFPIESRMSGGQVLPGCTGTGVGEPAGADRGDLRGDGPLQLDLDGRQGARRGGGPCAADAVGARHCGVV